MAGWKRFGASVALTAFVVAQTVMIRMSRDSSGNLPYNPAAATFLNELIKLIVSFSIWWIYDKDSDYNGLAGITVQSVLYFSVPGLIYAIQNSLVFYALCFLEPPTFQVFASLKIITTAILFRVILIKVLTIVQWAALVQLFLSMVVTKMGSLLHRDRLEERRDLLIGACVLFVNSCLSATSGIANEWLIKKQDKKAPLMIKSIQLYAWGTLINFMAWIANDAGIDSLMSLTSPLVMAIILNNAAVGLSVAFIMKYADNIVKCFSTAAAVFISAVLSSVLFKFPLDLPFGVGLVSYSAAFFLYFGSHNTVLRNANMVDIQWFPCLPVPQNEEEVLSDKPHPKPEEDLELVEESAKS